MLFDGGSLNGATDERPIPQLDLDEIRSSRPEKKVFSCELCDIFKNTFFIEQLLWLLRRDVNIESVEEDELLSIWKGSWINCVRPNCKVAAYLFYSIRMLFCHTRTINVVLSLTLAP